MGEFFFIYISHFDNNIQFDPEGKFNTFGALYL